MYTKQDVKLATQITQLLGYAPTIDEKGRLCWGHPAETILVYASDSRTLCVHTHEGGIEVPHKTVLLLAALTVHFDLNYDEIVPIGWDRRLDQAIQMAVMKL